MGAMRVKASRVKRLIRRKMQTSDRTAYLHSLISAMNRRTAIRGITPGEALIQLRSPHWELFVNENARAFQGAGVGSAVTVQAATS